MYKRYVFPACDHRGEDSSGDRAIKRLLIRPGAIGDCLLALPAMQFVSADHEHTEVWVPSAIQPLIQFAGKVDSLAHSGIDTFGIEGVPVSERLLGRLKEFDEVVSWYGSNRPEFREAMRGLHIKCVFHSALPDVGSRVHASDFFAQQVGAPLGLFPHLRFASCEPRSTVVIHPFSGSSAKNWPLNNYREMAVTLPMQVEWLAGPNDNLEEAVRFDDLGLLAAWLSGASVYVGNDSGITHLAAALGVRTVALFGPTDPRVWGPRGTSVTCIQHQPLNEIDVEKVRRLVLG